MKEETFKIWYALLLVVLLASMCFLQSNIIESRNNIGEVKANIERARKYMAMSNYLIDNWDNPDIVIVLPEEEKTNGN